MNWPELEGTITEIQPIAEHGGKIYEQTVQIRTTENSGEYSLFDGSGSISTELIGSTVVLEVSVLPSGDLERVDGGELGIYQPEEPTSEWSYLIRGKLKAIDVSDEWYAVEYERLLLLDVGIGSILIQPDNSMINQIDTSELVVGDQVEVHASRTEIVGLNTQSSQEQE